MDFVIPYVNGLDPLWLEDYRKAVGGAAMTKRFRDWGTLKYVLRGVEQCMPFVDRVHLVVSRESQVPEEFNTKVLNVVTHDQIIPKEYLPVFNSTAIEMFIHLIPGLSEKFIYSNDDFYPVSPSSESLFFENGKARTGFTKMIFATGTFQKQVRNSDRLAREVAGVGKSIFYRRPQHICQAMLKSDWDELYNKANAQILASVTPVREDGNFNQYLFSDYSYYIGHTVRHRIPKKHFSLAAAGIERICSEIENPSVPFICINDVNFSQEKFLSIQSRLLTSFEKRFPQKSKYEL